MYAGCGRRSATVRPVSYGRSSKEKDMKRIVLVLVAGGLMAAMLAGCHAEAGGSVGKESTMVPALSAR
jgi:hypothetical protein